MKDKNKSKNLRINLADSALSWNNIEEKKSDLVKIKQLLLSGEASFTGWVDLPESFDKEEIERIKSTAEEIRAKCDAFVVIGIGGSYLGARAAIEMLGENSTGPKIYYAGQNISAAYHLELIEEIKEKEVCICIISKSGTTTESAVAFAILKDFLIRKYGETEANRRIFAITDKDKGVIREEARRRGYVSFVVPDDIGGRYSVLSAVGLLPIAVAGIDIEMMLDGAREIAKNNSFESDIAAHYAAARILLFDIGKHIEIFESYEPRLFYFLEWLKQLFGESEGKEGKGVFPASLQFSTDLHSMGQFLQEGHQIFFETVINIENPQSDIIVPRNAGQALGGASMNDINRAAFLGVMEAHRKAGIPIITIDIPELTSYYFGQMVYFFECACAFSGYLFGVNPFDQPGVEAYKSEMLKVLGVKG
jgi:glucose-6-phosphate isomerase